MKHRWNTEMKSVYPCFIRGMRAFGPQKTFVSAKGRIIFAVGSDITWTCGDSFLWTSHTRPAFCLPNFDLEIIDFLEMCVAMAKAIQISLSGSGRPRRRS